MLCDGRLRLLRMTCMTVVSLLCLRWRTTATTLVAVTSTALSLAAMRWKRATREDRASAWVLSVHRVLLRLLLLLLLLLRL